MKRVTILFMEEDAAFLAAQAGEVDVAYTSATYSDQTIGGYSLAAYDSVDNRGFNLPAVPAGTDSQGRTVDFKNTIVIMTSNIGSAYLTESIRQDGTIDPAVEERVDALARMALEQCRALNPDRLPVVLSGGVFLNQYLLREVTRLLEAGGFAVCTHRRVSPSDEGLALGQLAIAARAAL